MSGVRWSACLAALCVIWCFGTVASALPGAREEGPEKGVAPGLVSAKDVLGEDVREKMREWSSSRFAQPSVKFRSGGVHTHQVGKDTVKTVGGGFRVRFNSGTQVTTPAVYQGLLFVSGGFSSHELYAFDAKNGKPVWALSLDDDGPSAPACADDVCVVNTESCTLFVVSARTGKLVWSKWLGDPLMSAPTISDGKVFASYPVSSVDDSKKDRPPSATHALAAFDLKTGRVLWLQWLDGDVMSSPVAVDDHVWATTFTGTVYELAQTDGALLAAHRSRATSAPVVVAGNVYFSARADEGGRAGEALVAAGPTARYRAAKKSAAYLERKVQEHAHYAASGLVEDSNNGFAGGAPSTANAAPAAALVGQASVSTLQGHQGSRIAWADGRNISTMGDEVIATDAGSGKKLWSVKLQGDVAKEGGFLATPPVAAGDSIVVGTVGGEVLRINAKDGAIVKRWPAGGPVRAQPVVEDGWIYAGTADGRLVAIDTGDRSLTGWSQWGGDAKRASVKK
jgi:outer membrane protein assembly factor BamB